MLRAEAMRRAGVVRRAEAMLRAGAARRAGVVRRAAVMLSSRSNTPSCAEMTWWARVPRALVHRAKRAARFVSGGVVR